MMLKPTVTVTFTIEVEVMPNFLTYINTDRSARTDIERALKEHNILRESEVVGKVSVEENRKQDEEDAYERMLFEDFP